jgi:uncharacterized protein (TIGR00369 family)
MKPFDDQVENRVRESFALQHIMTTIGARMTKVGPGEVNIELPFRDDLTQHNMYLHAGVVSIILDSACGYAAYTLIPPGANMLTVEFKITLVRPASGKLFVAKGRCIKPGKTLSVCQGEVVNDDGKAVAVMTSTLMTLPGDGA